MTHTAPPPTLERAIEQAIVEGLTAGTASDADYAALSDLYRERGEEELAELAWWMRDKGHWPHRDAHMNCWCWWDIEWIHESNATISKACRLPNSWLVFYRDKEFHHSRHPTLLSALQNYCSAHQARQLMRDGSHMAVVPREVAVCPVCNGNLAVRVRNWGWGTNGFPRKSQLWFPNNHDETPHPHRSWTFDEGNVVADAVARWCKAVD